MKVRYPRAVLVVLGVLIIVGLVSAASSSSVAFGTYNSDWDGTAELRAMVTASSADVEIVRNVSAYDRVAPGEAVAVVLSPTNPYTATEAAHLRTFVEEGGTLVVAEDVGSYGSALLQAVGSDARFDGAPLHDERYHADGPAFPIARNVTDHPLTAGTNALTLNYATAVHPGTATVLASSSGFAYLDRNQNGSLDPAETVRPYPVAATERIGDGRVVAIGDPSVFINAMLERRDNRVFVQNLFTEAEVVVLDRSHVEGDVPPLISLVVALRESPAAQFTFGLVGILLVGVGTRYPVLVDRLRRSRTVTTPRVISRLDSDSIARVLARRHPDWDEQQVRRVMAGIIHNRNQADRDE